MAQPEAAPSPRQFLPLDLLREHPNNPRKTYSKASLLELATSFKGDPENIHQEILCRPHPSEPGAFQIVSGHRRSRAASIAGFEGVPGRVKDLTDDEVEEIQLIENGQREDLHPMEEAEAIESLRVRRGFTYDQISKAIGKSETLIFRRLKLLALVKPARKAFLAGKLTEATAFMLARVPRALQERALVDLTKEARVTGADDAPNTFVDRPEPLSAPEARDLLQRRYMLPLDTGVPFDPEDVGLVPDAGTCSSCPKRTGSDKNLFGDIDGEDVCTDPDCYESKVSAEFAAQAVKVGLDGGKVIDGEEAAKMFPYGNMSSLGPEYARKYVKLSEHSYDINMKLTEALDKIEKVLNTVLPRVLVADPSTGAPMFLMERPVWEKAVKESKLFAVSANGLKPKKDKKTSAHDTAVHDEAKKANAARKIRKQVVEQLVATGGARDFTFAAQEALARATLSCFLLPNPILAAKVSKALTGKPIPEGGEYKVGVAFLEKMLPKLSAHQLQTAIFVITAQHQEPYDDFSDATRYAAAAVSFDLDKAVKLATKEAEAKTEAAKEAQQAGKVKQSLKSAKKADRKVKAAKAKKGAK